MSEITLTKEQLEDEVETIEGLLTETNRLDGSILVGGYRNPNGPEAVMLIRKLHKLALKSFEPSPMKLHFTDEWLKSKIESDPDD